VEFTHTIYKIFNFNSIYHAWYIAEAIGILADIVSQMLLSNGSGEVHRALQGKILIAFLGENMPIFS
jgi:hypothetical protein